MTLGDFEWSQTSTARSISRPLCDSWASYLLHER